jgi:hypothetical protein
MPNSEEYHPHCTKFSTPPPILAWEEVYSLEWSDESPAIIGNINATFFPTTRFTSHVQELVRLMDISQMEANCFWKFTLTLEEPNSRPTDLFCQGKPQQRLVPWWCDILERLFFQNYSKTDDSSSNSIPNPQSANVHVGRALQTPTDPTPPSVVLLDPILPATVSFAISSDDFYKKPKPKRQQRGKKKQPPAALAPYTCLASSAPNGTFCLANYLELQRMADRTTYPILPWDQRCQIPIWRGSAWIGKGTATTTPYSGDNTTQYPILHQALQDCPRCRAVEFSRRSPLLLDAKFGDAKNGFFHPLNTQYQAWWAHNQTNGLERLLPIHYIPPTDYFSQYQTALVLCGLGAAFRTPIHFSTATAVVLQDCPHHEWYHGWVEPWTHYIPLQADLTDLPIILEWIQEHPDQVQAIALAGRQFYQDYLSFQRNYEHFYEFIYRLAWKKMGEDERLQNDGNN